MAPEIHTMLKTIVPFLESLPDYERATPRTRKVYRQLGRTLNNHTLRFVPPRSRSSSPHPSQAEPTPGTGADPSDIENEIKPTKDQITRLKLIRRSQDILAFAFKLPLSPSEVFRLVTHHDQLSRERAEDAALQRIFQGYEKVPLKRWAKLFSDISDHEKLNFDVFHKATATIDTIKTDTKRLTRRHVLISHYQQRMSTIQFIFSILYKIEHIKFAAEWNTKGTEQGGKKWKGKFLEECFQAEFDEIFEPLDPGECSTMMETMHTEFVRFKKNMESVVTARNQLLDVYKLFGAAILIDPFWDIANLGTKRTKKFRELYQHLAQTQPVDNVGTSKLDQLNHDTQDIVYSLCVALAGNDIGKYVRDFMTSDSFAA